MGKYSIQDFKVTKKEIRGDESEEEDEPDISSSAAGEYVEVD